MKYFTENEPTSPLNYRYPIQRILYRGRSRYQKILVFDSPFHGRVLALDNIVQLTTREEPFYHELLVHPALQAHPDPKRVLVVGGGDGGTVRELVKYPGLVEIVETELDAAVVRVSRKYFPEVASGYSDPRVRLLFQDGRQYLRDHPAPFDVILLDLTDPIGPARPLFQEPFYKLCAARLTRHGLLSAQTESLHFHRPTTRAVYRALSRVFPRVECAAVPLAMYPGNWWTFSLASRSRDPRVARNPFDPPTSYYLRTAHPWFFIPTALRERLLA